jgi:beta-lactam-binding protein with PASTA domain
MACLSPSSSFLRRLVLVLGILWMIFAAPSRLGAQTYPFTLDFEEGTLRGWTATGDAFKFQPTRGDNPTARQRGQPSKHLGNYWIGTYEKYQGKRAERPGDIQGDGPQGYLTSAPFIIPRGRLTFLVGGGASEDTKVELLAGPSSDIEFMKVAHSARGKDFETMERVSWDLSDQAGMTGKIRIVDASSGPWGHINVDDFRFEPPQQPSPRPQAVAVAPARIRVPVPRVVGDMEAEAVSKLSQARLQVGRVTRQARARIKPGVVFRQEPGAAQLVIPGSAVDLWVAKPETTVVPGLFGQYLEPARAKLKEARLQPGRVTRRVSDRPEGTVVGQSPQAEQQVPVDTVVDLVLAETQTVVVPGLVGQSQEAAKALLAKGSLGTGRVEEAPSDRPAGTILGQYPQAGTHVKAGSQVDLVVAARPQPPPTVEVPPVEGRDLEEAVDILRRARLRAGGPEKRPSAARPGTVIRQRPAPGNSVDIGSEIALVVAIPPPPATIEVPDVTGRSLADARNTLVGWGLTLGVVGKRVSDLEPDSVLEQSPKGGSQVHPGDAVSLVVAAEKASGVPIWFKLASGLVAGGAAGAVLLRLRGRSRRKVGGKGEPEVIAKPDAGSQEIRFPREKDAPNWEIVLRPVADPGQQALEVNGPLIAEKEGSND